uniref:Uncharacterized protein n=1 Tax=Pseudo-nitzschia australis TaxID=44445 RepID=A0A7S4AVS7_9STRA
MLLYTLLVISNPTFTHVNGMPVSPTTTIENENENESSPTITTRRSLLRGSSTTPSTTIDEVQELEQEYEQEYEQEQTPAHSSSSWSVLSSVEGAFRKLLNGCGQDGGNNDYDYDFPMDEESEDSEEEEATVTIVKPKRGKPKTCAEKPEKPVTCTLEAGSEPETFRNKCAAKQKNPRYKKRRNAEWLCHFVEERDSSEDEDEDVIILT